VQRYAAQRTEIRKQEGNSYGQGDRVLRPDELSDTVETGVAAGMRKGYRVLHAEGEIHLASERDRYHSVSEIVITSKNMLCVTILPDVARKIMPKRLTV
jgi:hypothetical protein